MPPPTFSIRAPSQGLLHALLLATVCVGFFLALGSAPLFDVDEGAFSEATREMFLRGDFLSTYLYGEPRHDKPILSYWLQALSVGLLGFHEWGFRLPSALMATGWVAAAYTFTFKVRGDRKQALAAALMTASSVLIVIIGRAATADALLNLLIALTLFSLYRYLIGHGLIQLYFAAAAAGFGFLAKGPVALIIPAVVSAVWFLSRKDVTGWITLIRQWRAWALFGLIALPWYAVQSLRDGGAFLQGFLLQHNFGRFNAALETHSGPFWYYLPVLLIGFLPFTGFILAALSNIRQRWNDPLDRWLLIWFGFILLFFSASGTKLPHYLLYGASALLVYSAPELLRERSRAGRLLMWSPLALAALGLLALPTLIAQANTTDPVALEMLVTLQAGFDAAYYGALILGLALITALAFFHFHPLIKTAVAGMGVSLFLVTCLTPLAAGILQTPVQEAARIARTIDAPTVLWRLHRPSFPIYVQRRVERREPRPGELVLTKSKERHALPAGDLLYERLGIALVRLHQKISGTNLFETPHPKY